MGAINYHSKSGRVKNLRLVETARRKLFKNELIDGHLFHKKGMGIGGKITVL